MIKTYLKTSADTEGIGMDVMAYGLNSECVT